MSRLEFGRRRFGELAVALVLVTGVVQLSSFAGDQKKDRLPVGAWFEVGEIYVPDHAAGSNPLMIYDRTIREGFTGFWIAEVQRVKANGLFQHECSGFGTSQYSTDEIIENNEVTWEWFLGRPCEVPPGRYRIRTSYTLKRAGWPEKEMTAISNIFTVD